MEIFLDKRAVRQIRLSAQDAIEELSGSILLPDQSGAVQTSAVPEKSGALLLPDLSGPAPALSAPSGPGACARAR